jgi:hypothetical protein
MASRSASGESPRRGSRRAPEPDAPDERFAGGGEPAGDLDEALARARRHARSAVAEAFEALRALLDAASLATSGASAGLHPVFAQADRWLRSGAHRLVGEGSLPGDLAASLAEALGAEIARWEEQARIDPDARAVLRAFLGLRELLWELGVRPASRPARGADRSDRDDSAPAAEAVPRRVERVAVEG